MNRSDWVNKYIVAGVLLQFVGYAALSALVPHSDFATVVEPLQRLPAVLLVLVALVAVPVVVIAIALGALLAVVGLQPTIALVLVGAYLVSIAGLWVYRRITE
jgi:putative Mn2+ efflux pump MntP